MPEITCLTRGMSSRSPAITMGRFGRRASIITLFTVWALRSLQRICPNQYAFRQVIRASNLNKF